MLACRQDPLKDVNVCRLQLRVMLAVALATRLLLASSGSQSYIHQELSGLCLSYISAA